MSDRSYVIERYAPERRGEWDAFVKASRNATFLHLRDFMDYHSDRFADHSLMVRGGGRLLALLPANITPDGVLHSHQGLTYGGWLLPERHFEASDMMAVMQLAMDYCRREGVTALDYKPVPGIYARMPSAEDIYALWMAGAERTVCNLSVTIDLHNNPGFNSRQKRNAARGEKCGGSVAELTTDAGIRSFSEMLAQCLAERHGTVPVHSADELILLHGRFPAEIRFYAAFDQEGNMQAGVATFDCGVALHAQYICSTEAGRRDGMLALLFRHIIAGAGETHRYFDFGICNEQDGRYLNEGLAAQKYGLGGSATIYERYMLRIE